MLINQVTLEGFRNYKGVSVEFCDGVNVISGKNAQGKTNLIESVYYLTSGRSFRSVGEKDLISFDSDYATVKANIVSSGREQTLEARLYRGRRREVFANGVKLKKMSELSGRLTAVMFGPDDLDIVKEGAAVRRKFMDQALSQLRPGYLAALTEFNRLHEHKTRILRDYREKPSLLGLLDDYDYRMGLYSAKLIYYRAAFAAGLARRASGIHKEFTDETEELEIKYKTVGGIDPTGKKPDELFFELMEHQNAHKQAELRTGHCLSGAHKDDLDININGAAARKFASQGQTRTAAVSIKMAERDIHHDDRGEYPVLLLDDVLSELDPKRQGFILSKITNGQVLITCCDESAASTTNGKVLKIENGNLV